MEISFRTKKLAKVCNSDKELLKSYGKQNAKVIMTRLAMLKSAGKLAQIPKEKPVKLHQLIGQGKGQYAVNLAGGFRLVFVPSNHLIPRTDEGGVDEGQITEIKIMYISDYH